MPRHNRRETGRTDDLPEEDLFRSIGNPRRRRTILALAEVGDATIEELSEFILVSETGDPPRRIGEDEQERVVVDLLHCHLPLLSETGIVYTTEEQERVVPRTTIDPVADYLRCGFRMFGYDHGLAVGRPRQ